MYCSYALMKIQYIIDHNYYKLATQSLISNISCIMTGEFYNIIIYKPSGAPEATRTL